MAEFEGLSIEPHVVAENPVVVYREKLPPELVDLMVKELKQMEEDRVPFEDGGVGGDQYGRNDLTVRNSKVNWWYEDHWSCSVVSHYINLANKRNWQGFNSSRNKISKTPKKRKCFRKHFCNNAFKNASLVFCNVAWGKTVNRFC